MLVRITAPLRGDVDGIDLSQYAYGSVYDMGVELACYLIATGAAEPADGYAGPLGVNEARRLFGSTVRGWAPRQSKALDQHERPRQNKRVG